MNLNEATVKGLRVVVLCPHTDDEFGCGGTIYRLARFGANIKYIALSRCEESVPAGFPQDILETECRNCLESLGVKSSQVEVWNFPVRHFPEHRQAILERLYKINKEFKPQLVILPTTSDQHQDHATVCAEGMRAFKHATLLGYELPQNNISFENSAFIELEEAEIDRKIESLASYKSQTFRPYAAPEYIKGLARVRGVQCNAQFAEAFEAIRFVMR